MLLSLTRLAGEVRDVCFTLNVFLLACVSLFLCLPHGTIGWSVVCDCGISVPTHLLYSMTSLLLCFESQSDPVFLLFNNFNPY